MKYLIIVSYSLIVIEKGNAHRQFNKISLCLSLTAKEKNRLIAIRAISRICGMNRRLAAGRLEIDFKKPFDLLAKLPAEARGEAPSEATNSIWWCLLDEIRTHFEQNPEDFAD